MRPTIRNEFAKMRHRGVAVLAVGWVLLVSALTGVTTLAAPERSWHLVLANLALAAAAVSPVLLAALASRQVEPEHESGGWLLAAGAGVTRGRLVRAKFAALAVVVAVATLAQVAVLMAAGSLVFGPPPLGAWLAYAGALLGVNLVVLAVQLALATMLDNQLMGLGIGVLGTLAALFASGLPTWLAAATPWGWYGLIAAADFRGGVLVPLAPSPVVGPLALAAAGAFWLLTRHFDRQES